MAVQCLFSVIPLVHAKNVEENTLILHISMCLLGINEVQVGF